MIQPFCDNIQTLMHGLQLQLDSTKRDLFCTDGTCYNHVELDVTWKIQTRLSALLI